MIQLENLGFGERILVKLFFYLVLIPGVLTIGGLVVAAQAFGTFMRCVLCGYFSYPVGLLLLAAPTAALLTGFAFDTDPFRSTILYGLAISQGLICIGVRLAINIFEKQEESVRLCSPRPRVP